MANLGIAIMQVFAGTTSAFPTLGVVIGLVIFGFGIVRKSELKGTQ
jgi:hypothetical protein